MKALSLWQPWASAIPAGLKSFETRSWSPHRSLIGQRIAIHAAKKNDHKLQSWWHQVVHGCADREKAFSAIGVKSWNAVKDGLPRGCIVATAVIVAVHPTHEIAPMISDEERMWGDYAPGRYAWELSQIMWVKPALPMKGRQGWFEWQPPE